MGEKYLIDSNVLIEFVAGLLPEKSQIFICGIIDNDFNISVINKIEVLGFHPISFKLNEFIKLAQCIGLSDEIADKIIEIRKSVKINLPDAIIAATAIVNNFTLVTRNCRDFEKIEDFKMINPHSL